MSIAAFLLLSACAPYTPDSFNDEAAAATCALAAQCGAWESEAECLEAVETEDTRGCTFDKDAAQTCVDALLDARCPADGGLPQEPESCAMVWTDCP